MSQGVIYRTRIRNQVSHNETLLLRLLSLGPFPGDGNAKLGSIHCLRPGLEVSSSFLDESDYLSLLSFRKKEFGNLIVSCSEATSALPIEYIFIQQTTFAVKKKKSGINYRSVLYHQQVELDRLWPRLSKEKWPLEVWLLCYLLLHVLPLIYSFSSVVQNAGSE